MKVQESQEQSQQEILQETTYIVYFENKKLNQEKNVIQEWEFRSCHNYCFVFKSKKISVYKS